MYEYDVAKIVLALLIKTVSDCCDICHVCPALHICILIVWRQIVATFVACAQLCIFDACAQLCIFDACAQLCIFVYQFDCWEKS